MPASKPYGAGLKYAVLVVSRIAVVAASWVVPREIRAQWRRAWISEMRHYAFLLRRGGLKRRYVRARIWHHFTGAMRDALRLFGERRSMRWLRLKMRTPYFSLGLIGLAFCAVIAGSRGLAVTRAMLFPPYPEAERLVLISQGNVLPSSRHAISPGLLEFWKNHNTTLSGLAGYRWDKAGTAWITPEFFEVLGARPKSFVLHRIRDWKPAGPGQDLAGIGRLKPGGTTRAAQNELRELAIRWNPDQPWAGSDQAQATSLVARTRKPFWAYGVVCSATSVLLLGASLIGMRTDRRRIGRIRGWYWAYFGAKSVLLPLLLALVIWEFTRATKFTLTGGATFVAEPFFVWLVILACGAIVWWCLVDQWARCRACLGTLQYPVRIGSLGAVLFNHAGTELMCCEGHGALYVPAVSSDYVQGAGWISLESLDPDNEIVQH